ncbi:MAG: DNA-binding protein [Gammaproteobacteria bacterium]|nr:DNA-binding protein [Gammaproteobacteria bacterium]
MGRPGITQEDVERAARELKAQGKNPTVDNVRQLLGTGSKTTITRHLRHWKWEQTHPLTQTKLPEELKHQMTQLWENINELAEQQTKVDQNSTEPTSELSQLKNQLFLLQQNYQQLSQQYNIALQKCLYLEKQSIIQQQKSKQQDQIILQKTNANHVQEQRIASLLNQLRETQFKLAQVQIQLETLEKGSAR